jgi:hypothetical protein
LVYQPSIWLFYIIVSFSAEDFGTATASIDGGSFNPAGLPIVCTQAPAGPYPIGTTAVTLTCVSGSLSSSCSADVIVTDNTAPSVTLADAALRQMTTPNHRMITFPIGSCVASAFDASGAVTVSFTKATSDEAGNFHIQTGSFNYSSIFSSWF